MIKHTFSIVLAFAVFFAVGATAGQGQSASVTPNKSAIEEVNLLGKRLTDLVNDVSEVSDKSALEKIFAPSMLAEQSIERVHGLVQYLKNEFSPLLFHHAELVEWETNEGTKRIIHLFAMQMNSKIWKDIQLGVTEGPGHRVNEIKFVSDVSTPIFLPNGNISSPFSVKWISEYLQRLNGEGNWSGSVMLAENDKVFFEMHLGAGAGQGAPPTANSAYSMGVASDLFTTIAIAQLVESGKLSFQTSIQTYFHEAPKDLQIKHLLNHTSGLVNKVDMSGSGSSDSGSEASVIATIFSQNREFSTGEMSSYSHSNGFLLEQIVAKVSGSTYASIVKSKIIQPLGMTKTKQVRPKQGEPRSSNVEYEITSHDLLTLALALRTGSLINAATSMQINRLSGAASPETGSWFSGGLDQETMEGKPFMGRVYSDANTQLAVEILPAKNLSLIILSSQPATGFDEIRSNLMKLMSGYR